MDATPNPFEGFLGDLVKMVGASGASGAGWREPAKGLAANVAAEDGGAENPDPKVRMALEQVAPVVALHVAVESGLTDPAYEVEAVSRVAFSAGLLEAWDRPIGQLAAISPTPPMGGDASQLGVEAILAQFASTMGPVLTGLQFGSAAGHLAADALGLSAVPVVPYARRIPIVAQNLAAFAEAWTLELAEAALFVVAREQAVASALAVPHVASALEALVDEAVAETAEAQRDLLGKLGGLGDPSALAAMAEDPESVLEELIGPGGTHASAALTSRVTVLLAWADFIAATVATKMTASAPALTEAWRRHRISDSKGEAATGALFGVDLSPAKVERAARFILGVVERAGTEPLADLWASPEGFPTEPEVDAPGLWLERIALGRNG